MSSFVVGGSRARRVVLAGYAVTSSWPLRPFQDLSGQVRC